MLVKQVTDNGTHPLGSLLYVYIMLKGDLTQLVHLLEKQPNAVIELTTMVKENVVESVILPKKFSENGI